MPGCRDISVPQRRSRHLSKTDPKRALARKRRADERKRRKAFDESAKQVAQEARDEEMAPAAQRADVLTADGEIYKHARLERSGKTFIRSNPVKYLRRLGETRRGGTALFTVDHETYSEKLILAWQEGGQGVGMGKSDYVSQSVRGTTNSGFSDAMLERMAYQRRQAALCAGAAAYMGSLWPCIKAVVLDGKAPGVWGKEVGLSRMYAVGYLAAALDKLVEFWKSAEGGRDDEPRPMRIRSVQIISAQADE